MTEPLPFRLLPVSGRTAIDFNDGRTISTLDRCGIFLCSRGEVEVVFEDRTYRIRRGDAYIYVASSLVRLVSRSEDVEGMMAQVDLDFVIPIINKVVSVESLLAMRQYPCFSLSAEQYRHLLGQLEDLSGHIRGEAFPEVSPQCRHLRMEWLKSMGQAICYEVLDAYFSNRPMTPLPQGKKDQVFHNFLLALFRCCRRERDVAFYAQMQHLTPRYFSTIIKEKSGKSALQWIVQMVISEAKLLLEDPDLSVKEIASRLNFPTQTFFGKYFKQYVGISPKEYRNKVIQGR